MAGRRPGLDWTTERYVRRTPVDVVGESPDGTTDPRFVAVELEWRRFRERSERLLVRERAKRVD